MSGFPLFLSVALSIGIIASAVAAWRGVPAAQYVLVSLVAVHYSLVGYQNYQMAAAGVEVRGSAVIPWVRVIRSIVTAGVIASYLLFSKGARDFFSGQRNAASSN